LKILWSVYRIMRGVGKFVYLSKVSLFLVEKFIIIKNTDIKCLFWRKKYRYKNLNNNNYVQLLYLWIVVEYLSHIGLLKFPHDFHVFLRFLNSLFIHILQQLIICMRPVKFSCFVGTLSSEVWADLTGDP